MSETKTVREACVHGKYAKHEWLAHDGFMPRYEKCDGGKEIEMFAMRLHSFNGGLWQFHMVDNPAEDGEPTHWAMALEVVEE